MAVVDQVYADDYPVMYGLTLVPTKEKLPGRFYSKELRPLSKHDPNFKLNIAEILDKKVENKSEQCLVKYKELPDQKKFYVWLPTSEIVRKE